MLIELLFTTVAKSIESVADVEAVVWAVGIVVVSSTVNTLESSHLKE